MTRKIVIIFISLLLGTLIMFQARSFQTAQNVFNRDSEINIFREVQILKDTDRNLKSEVAKQQEILAQNTDKSSALKAIEAEIQKYKLLSGDINVSGPGAKITITGDLDLIWIVDLINELYSSGAEAVSVNNIRLTNFSNGFDLLPNGQLLLNGVILNQPDKIFSIKIIGDGKTVKKSLEQAGGYISRFKDFYKNRSVINVELDNLIDIGKV